MDRIIKVDGLHDDNQEWVFDRLYNSGPSVNVVASEDAPHGLTDAMREFNWPWKTFIAAGAEELMGRWLADPALNVKAATTKMYQWVPLSDFGMAVRHMAQSFDSESEGYNNGEKVAFFLGGSIWVECAEESLDFVVEEWGLGYSDFACLCAAVAVLGQAHGDAFINKQSVQSRIERTERYLRRKVWLLDVLSRAALSNPLQPSVLEQAMDMVEASHG